MSPRVCSECGLRHYTIHCPDGLDELDPAAREYAEELELEQLELTPAELIAEHTGETMDIAGFHVVEGDE